VLVAGQRIYVGLSTRTNHDAIAQLARALQRFAYEVVPVEFSGCLHLKTGVTRIADDLLLLNPAWVDAAAFDGYRAVHVAPAEPFAANALHIGGMVIFPAHFPATRARLEAEGMRVAPVPLVELTKAEAGVTCCSLLLDSH
jgi:dimethylargininase